MAKPSWDIPLIRMPQVLPPAPRTHACGHGPPPISKLEYMLGAHANYAATLYLGPAGVWAAALCGLQVIRPRTCPSLTLHTPTWAARLPITPRTG